MDSLAKLIGNRLKEIRKAKGLRQEDMEWLGISYKYYQRIEAGRANITLKTLEKVAIALGVNTRSLLSLPLDNSPEMNELAALVTRIIQDKDNKAAKKVSLFIKEFLNQC